MVWTLEWERGRTGGTGGKDTLVGMEADWSFRKVLVRKVGKRLWAMYTPPLRGSYYARCTPACLPLYGAAAGGRPHFQDAFPSFFIIL